MATYKVNSIEFDYDSEDGFPEHGFSNVLGMEWEADDIDDLVEEITAATGFCVNNIDAEVIV